MAQFGRKTTHSRTGRSAGTGTGLNAHQERVYGEFFKAIEQVGRRLERTEEERDRLSTRVSHLESRAERDELTGNYYLPVRAGINDDAQTPPMPKSVMAASFVSVFVALIALGVVMTQEPTLSKEQIAALQLNPPQYANLNPQSPYWQKLDLAPQPNSTAPEGAATETVARDTAIEDAEQQELAMTRPDESGLSDVVSEPDPLIQSILDSLENTNADTVPIGNTITPEMQTAMTASAIAKEVVEDIPIEDIAPAAGEAAEAETTIPTNNTQQAETVEAGPASTPKVETAAVSQKNTAPVKAVPEQPKTTTALKASAVLTPVSDIQPDPNLPQAVKPLEARALQGVAEAQHDLATLYAAGNSVTLNFERAIHWFEKAADAGIANAHYNLGVMAHQGLGRTADMAVALSWYQNASELGHPEALYNLGMAYTEGIGTEQNIDRGASYFKRAAEVGVPQAAYNLGILYESSFLGGIDKVEAGKWYKLAAEAGHEDAMASYARVTGQPYEIGSSQQAALQSIEPAAGSANRELIESIQSLLITEKYLPGYADGVLSAQTIDAIKAYERANGLPVTGDATPGLLSHMRAE